MKRILALLLVAATMLVVPTSVFAAEIDTETDIAVTEQQQNETKPSFPFGKGFKRDGVKKPAALPEGCEKPDLSMIKGNGFGKFRGFEQKEFPSRQEMISFCYHAVNGGYRIL